MCFTSASTKIWLVRAAVVICRAVRIALARPFGVVSGCTSSIASVASGNEIGAAVVVRLARRIALTRFGQVGSSDSASTDAGIVRFTTTHNNCIITI